MAVYGKKNQLMSRIWVKDSDKQKLEKLAKDRKLYLYEMIEKMIKNYKEE